MAGWKVVSVRGFESLRSRLRLALLEQLPKYIFRLPRIDRLLVGMPDCLHAALERIGVELSVDHVPQRTDRRLRVELVGAVRVEDRIVQPLAQMDLAHLLPCDSEIRAPDAKQISARCNVR